MEMEKINKAAARKLYKEGKQFIAVPSKCSPSSLYAIRINSSKHGEDADFDKWYNGFWVYNCNNELGNTVHFYI